MPIPFLNIINGGKHAETGLAIQEYMIAPLGKTFKESLRMGSEIYHELKKIIATKYGKSQTSVGDEGGFAPSLKSLEEPFILIEKACRELGYQRKVKFALDCAASEFYHPLRKAKETLHPRGRRLEKVLGSYFVDGKYMRYTELAHEYEKLIKRFPILSIEDPFDQDAWEHWQDFNHKLGKKVQIIGDDLLVTNPKRIQMATRYEACNALLLKVNQIGTLTESLEAAKLAMKSDWNVMVSHRSGETTSTFISDLAVALRCGQIKSGAPCRGERVVKYNRLLQIEEESGAKYAGRYVR